MSQVRQYRWLRSHKELHDKQINSLKYAGLWAIDQGPLFVRHAHFVYNKFIIATMFTLAITIFADICANMNDLSIVTDDGCVLIGICLVLFKTMIIQFRREKVLRLIEEILMCGEELCMTSDADIQHVLDRFLLRSSVCFHGFSVIGLFLLAALIFFAPHGSLPIRAQYPIDVSKTPLHEFAFALQTFALCGGMLAIVSIDSAICTLCNDMIMISDALSVNFEHCRDLLDDNDYSMQRTKKDFETNFKKYLRFHQRLIAALNGHNQIFSSSMLVQLISSTLVICLTGFQAIVVRGQGSNILRFGIYLIAAVSQLLHMCWIGNELIHSCAQVDRYQWLSNWNSKPLVDVRMLMILSTIFSRQFFRIKAGSFYTVSLGTFVAIMRKSYSAFALLNKIHSEGDK